jgi:hypothetical protein
MLHKKSTKPMSRTPQNNTYFTSPTTLLPLFHHFLKTFIGIVKFIMNNEKKNTKVF